MKHLVHKLVGKGCIALIVSLLMIGFIVGTNVIQPHLVAKAAASGVSHQQTDQDQSTGNIHGFTIGFVDQGMLPHLESNSNHSTADEQHKSTPPGSTMPAMATPGTNMPGMDMPGMNMPGMNSGQNVQNPSMGMPFDAKTIVLGSFAVFNGLILIIAAFLKRKPTKTHKKMNQYSRPKESVV